MLTRDQLIRKVRVALDRHGWLDVCPKCHRQGWFEAARIEILPGPAVGTVGGQVHCSFCGHIIQFPRDLRLN